MNSKKYASLANELCECIERHRGVGGIAEKLIIEVQEAVVFNIEQLDTYPELKPGVCFMLQGTSKALVSKRIQNGCIGRKVTSHEERAIEECAVAIARAATQIDLRSHSE